MYIIPQKLKKSLDAFFNEYEPKVAVIKGSWGVGKTYFWNKYIAQKIADKNLNQVRYVYISLFGKTSLSDVKKSMFYSEPINSDAKIEKAPKNKSVNLISLSNLPHLWKKAINKVQPKTSRLNRFAKNYQDIPAVEKFSNIISGFEYSIIDNYVICFDDLERKADALTVKEVMGLIDELATRKNCKVILIFNENELGENTGEKNENTNKKEFDSYREKIVDIELNYEPTYVENMNIAFPDDFKHLSIIENVANELKMKNIRVLKKIHQMIKEFDILSKEHPNLLIEEFITHATFLCWGYFIYREDLSFETIKYQLSQKSWMDYMSDEKREKTPGEERYSQIASNLKLFPSRFDTHIIDYLEHGFVDKKELNDTVLDLLASAEIEQLRVKFEKAWDIYRDSFKDNLAEFIIALKNILKEDMDNLKLSYFSSIITPLEEFGDESVLIYIEDYVERHKESLKNIDLGSWDVERIKNEDLKAKIYEIYKENKNFNIDDVVERIAEHQSYGSEDVNFLSSLDKEDFRAWMKGSPENLVKKIKKGLFIFRGSGGHPSQEEVNRINSNVKDALKDIAKENALNKKRVKHIYEIELEEKENDDQK